MLRWIVSIILAALAGFAEYFWLIHNPIIAFLVGLNFMLTFALARVRAPFWTKTLWYINFVGILSGPSLAGAYHLRVGISILVLSTGWAVLSLASRRSTL